MSWETPRTYTTGETITASILNTDVRENFRWLYSPPGCRVFHDADQTFPIRANRQLDFNKTMLDTDSMHGGVERDDAPASAYVNFRTAGRYILTVSVNFGQPPYATSWIGKNSPQVLIAGKSSVANPTVGADANVCIKTLDTFAVDDFAFLIVHSDQQQANAATVTISSFYPLAPTLSAHWMGN